MIEIIETEMKPIVEVADQLGIDKDSLYCYGKYIAKVPYDYKKNEKADAKLVLVTAMTPTKSGEGKTLTSVGLSMALNKLGKKAVACLRQGSMGPTFGIKGAAVGSGKSIVLPVEETVMGLTGDLDAVTNANNLLSAIIDNHIYQGNLLNIDKVIWKRCLDTCDRSLKNIKSGWTKKGEKTEVNRSFDITAASEMLTILTLSKDIEELRERLGNILVAFDKNNNPVYAKQLNCIGSLLAILKKAFNPNLVQTFEGTPVLIHGGNFANIASGTNTIVNTTLGMRLADYVVTEAGFASDLGAEKFLDIKCRQAGISPDCVVLVATIKALRHHGGSDDENVPNIENVKVGLSNLRKHIDNLKNIFNQKVIVSINMFPNDTEDEVEFVRAYCNAIDIPCVLNTAYSNGSDGAFYLAQKVIEFCESEKHELKYSYELNKSIKDKINSIATKVYGSKFCVYSEKADDVINQINSLGYNDLPVCIAKTQYSFSDDPKLLNAPKDWILSVTDVELKTGAGMIVVICGNIVTMPGLPKVPNAEKIDVIDGKIVGLQ